VEFVCLFVCSLGR